MKTLTTISTFGMLLILSGCVTLYKPNTINSPVLKEKGDLNTTGIIGFSGCGLFNVQSSYAITDHAGVMIDGMIHSRNNSSADSSVEKLRMYFGETGAGYFTAIGNKNNGLFQCYGGGGFGITRDKINYSYEPNPEVSAKYFNLFIQPGCAYTSKNFIAAFDLRANYVRLFDIHAYMYDRFEFWNTDYRYYSDTAISFLNLEPTVTLKFGGQQCKGIFQLGVTVPSVNSDAYFDVNTSSMLVGPLIKISMGINYTFGLKRKSNTD
jgi:hypothetical protein